MEFVYRNVHEALPRAVQHLKTHGLPAQSRNGEVIVMQDAVKTVFTCPLERVMFHPERDANPFLHFFESLWMLAGRNDVKFVANYAVNMRNFSDDGVNLHGAYGYRWRKHFQEIQNLAPVDQLAIIAERLSRDPTDRRAVLAMWDCPEDLGIDSKDIPCNLNCKFNIRGDGKLHMEVDNRSNDIIWGLYGANAVHFSFLLEYMAAKIGVGVGTQAHNSFNFHAYRTTLDPVQVLTGTAQPSPYHNLSVRPYPIMNNTRPEIWDKDLKTFFLNQADNNVFPDIFVSPFFRDVVCPMYEAHRAFKTGKGEDRYRIAIELLAGECRATDWKLAAIQWLSRRHERWKIAADTGVHQ